MKRIQHLILYIFVFSTLSLSLAQQNPVNHERANDIEIKLVTIGPGDDLTSWWGHTAVIVDDKRLNSSLFYNYGLFSFDQDNFIINFAMGRLIFWVAAWNTRDALAHYLSLNRDIRMQVLDLTPEKKIKMVKFLANNIRPENRSYLYHHYRDNCSTRVRDLIDHVLDGQFFPEMQNTSIYTFRQHTIRHTDRSFVMNWILMFLMSDNIDQEIFVWDDMFLPEEMEKNVDKIFYMDENGTRRKLVKSSYPYYEAKNRASLPKGVPVNWPLGLFYGILLGLIALVSGVLLDKGYNYSNHLFGSFHIIIGGIFGVPGLVLFFLNFFTDHTVTYNNENLLLSNPLTFLYLPLGIFLILGKKFSHRWLSILSYLLAGSGLLLLILKILPAFDQRNELSIALILPVSIGMAVSWYLQGKDLFGEPKIDQ